MRLPRPRRWAVAAFAVLVVAGRDGPRHGPDVVVIALYGTAPLRRRFGTGWRTTAVVAVIALALADLADDVRRDGQHQRRRLRPHRRAPGAPRVRHRGHAHPPRGIGRPLRPARGGRRAARGRPGPGRDPASPSRRRGPRRRGPLHDRPDRPERRPRQRAAAQVPRRRRPRRRRRWRGSRAAAPPETSRGDLVVPLEARGVRLGALELGVDGSVPPLRRRGPRARRGRRPPLPVALDNARLVGRGARPPRASYTRPTGCSTRSSSAPRSASRSTTSTCATCASTTAWRRSTACTAAEHIGRTVAEILPDVEAVEADLRRRARERRAAHRARGRRARPPPRRASTASASSPTGLCAAATTTASSASAPSSSRSPSGAPPSARRTSRRRATSRSWPPCRRSGRRWSWRTPTAGSSTRTPPSRRSAATAPRSSRRCRPSSTSSSTSSARAPASGRESGSRAAAARATSSRSATVTATGSRWRSPACRSTSAGAARWWWSPATSRRAPAPRPSASSCWIAPPSSPRRAPPSTRCSTRRRR